VLQGPGLYYFDREWGGGISARYPLSIFTRFSFNLSAFSVTRNLYDAVYGVTVPDYIFPHERLNVVKPSVSWVNDNAEYGITGPVLGRRARLTASLVPAMFDDSVAFWQLDGDYRKYWLMSKRYSFALRVTAGFSQPLFDYANPQVYLGGGDDLIPFVARTNPENGPETLAEVAFSQLAVPMRGFRYYEFSGNRKFITNFEFRYPFIETLRLGWPLPLSINYLMGVLFVDYGGAWRGVPWESELEMAARTLGIGYGYGFRLNLGIFVLRYTQAYTVDDVGPGEGESRSYWSIGADF
jgi:outer membrane protein assembly factor BamA